MTDIPVAEYYYKKLQERESNKIVLLVSFCGAMFGNDVIVEGFYPRMGKIVVLYGYRNVFFAILSLVNIDKIDGDKLLNFIEYNCRKNLEKKETIQPYNDLTKFVKEVEKSMKKRRNLKIPKRSISSE